MNDSAQNDDFDERVAASHEHFLTPPSFFIGPVHTGGMPGHHYAQFGRRGHKYRYTGKGGRKGAENKARKQELAALYHGWNGHDDALSRSFHERHHPSMRGNGGRGGRRGRGDHRHGSRTGDNINNDDLQADDYDSSFSLDLDENDPKQRASVEVNCANCFAPRVKTSVGVCSGCNETFYCDATCQLEHWDSHQQTCGK